jgi:hypothetical protein
MRRSMAYQERRCSKCNIVLDSLNFKWYRAKNYIWKCNDCVNLEKKIQAKNSRKNNPELSRNRSARYIKNLREINPVKYTCQQMLASSRKRANALNMDNDIDTEFLISIAPVKCPVLLVKIKYGGGEKTKASASLDRIDSSLGYTKDNVQIISNLANMMKNEANESELLNFAKWVKLKYKGKSK